MSSRNSLKIEPKQVEAVLQSNGPPAAKPSPTEHVTTPASPALSRTSSGRASFQNHARGISLAGDSTANGATRSNRFSMSFPVQPSGAMSPVRMSQSPVRESFPTLPEDPSGHVDTNFLTAIAAQERRVLELKEELVRAEGDLRKLKVQWAQHEAQKKRNDARSVTKLQPLQTSLPPTEGEEDADGSGAWMQQEMERRKALLSGNKSSNRTVFSGSKHTRTLSLLSPTGRMPPPPPPSQQQQQPQRPELPSRKDSLPASARRSVEVEPRTRPKSLARAATTPDLTVDGSTPIDKIEELAEHGDDRDLVLIEASKKVATGLRDGLWTFWEDLRQATVGDESTPIHPPRRQSSTQTLRTAKKQASKASLRPSSRGSTASKTSTDTRRPSPARRKSKSTNMSLGSAPALADPSFWTEHGILPPSHAQTPAKKAPTTSKHAKSPSKAISVDSTDNESWSNWDEASPQFSRASSAGSDPTTVSDTNSPRASADSFDNGIGPNDTIKPRSNRFSVDSVSKKDPIPWPALSNLGPKALRRTASHLMSEWERSLTPSPGKEGSGGGHYLGLGAEAAASAVSGERKRG
ncbi:uncharacterized protein LTR77_009742 [Saxophila tyrrhenica]|uniref:DUF4048 domain-containing protein n=1 Tax=Saxophila tyrrhenica TaxID=1690608 RepID=A0AAV9NY00_9PEZI|nr:hypothetical protein LTR77_009742 [Saxophila tyrrhenica]